MTPTRTVATVEGRFERVPAIFVFDAATGDQVGTYFLLAKGPRLVAKWHGGRRYRCSRRFPTVEALLRAQGWTLAQGDPQGRR